MEIRSPQTDLALGSHSMTLRDRGVSGDTQTWEITVDHVVVGAVELLRYYRPEIVVDGSLAGVWGGSRLYVINGDLPAGRFFERRDDIIAVHLIPPLWYIVSESAVSAFDPRSGLDVRRVLHDDVILESELRGDKVWIKDLSGRSFLLSP